MAEFAIQVDKLTKKYGKLVAVNDISFKVRKGISFGLLGPNGAGKTTTLKMMSTLIRPDSGSAFIAGYDVNKDPMQVRRRIGYVSENPSFYTRMTTLEILKYIGRLLDIPDRLLQQRIEDNLQLVGLMEKKNNYIGEYSRGMRHRLCLAQALLAEPEVLFLDEPTLGLDPVGARDMRDLIVHLRQQKDVTIVMSSHTLPEVELICDEIAVFNHGKIAALDSVANLRSEVEGQIIEVILTENCTQVIKMLEEMDVVDEVKTEGNRIIIKYHAEEEVRPLILKTIFNINPNIISFGSREISLEDILFRLLQEG